MVSESRTRPLLELLVRVSREVAAALDLRTVLQRLLFAAIQYVGGERGSIVVMDDNGKPVDATIVYGRQFHDHTTQQLRETVEKGLAGWVVQNRKAVLVPDTSKDDRWLRRADDAADKSGPKSAICVPLMARDKMVGVLTLVHPVPNSFNPDHLELMQAIADQASIAVLNARLYTETQRRARIMSALAEGAAAINTSLEMNDVLRRILTQTMQALQVETVALALADNKNDLVFHAAAGNNSGSVTGNRIPAGQGIAGIVMNEKYGVVIPNVRLDSRFKEADKLNGVETRALAIAPIQAHGKTIGVIEAINPTTGSFDADALVVMSGLGSLAGTTIENAALFERLQKAHQHYRELFEDSIDMIFITDWDGKVLEANRQAVKLSGYPLQELHEITIDQLHEVNWNKTGLNFDTLKTGKGCNYESGMLRQDGVAVYVEVYARRVEYDSTDAIQWIMKDVSARKELDALRDDMTSMIFHDLRSPLGNIVSSLEMMSSLLPKEDDTLSSMLTIAKNSTGRIQRLVNSLLDINRLESGQPIAEQNSINPVELVRESLQDVQPGANARQQTIENRATSVLPLIWIDQDMIYRVLVNLVENAIKFTPVNGHIEVGAQPTSDGMFVKFWVKDTGTGIPAADQERIFEKFTRLRAKNRPGGLGVGLAFCKLAVNGHGGEIWVESEVDKGTTFWLTLPVSKKQATGQLKRVTGRLTFKPDKKNGKVETQP
ncbi:MAG: GAF domain-containing protein [Anaerolineales bacterium]|nr:GAF domain-containing protein [Anaerolineales bacterium]